MCVLQVCIYREDRPISGIFPVLDFLAISRRCPVLDFFCYFRQVYSIKNQTRFRALLYPYLSILFFLHFSLYLSFWIFNSGLASLRHSQSPAFLTTAAGTRTYPPHPFRPSQPRCPHKKRVFELPNPW